MKIPFLSLLTLTLLAGCAARRPPQTPLAPCQRVRIDPAPLWTASAAWTPEQDRLVLIGPGRRSLLVYDLAGSLVREVALDPLAELDYASPIRLEATRDGYVLGDQTQILWLDRGRCAAHPASIVRVSRLGKRIFIAALLTSLYFTSEY